MKEQAGRSALSVDFASPGKTCLRGVAALQHCCWLAPSRCRLCKLQPQSLSSLLLTHCLPMHPHRTCSCPCTPHLLPALCNSSIYAMTAGSAPLLMHVCPQPQPHTCVHVFLHAALWSSAIPFTICKGASSWRGRWNYALD